MLKAAYFIAMIDGVLHGTCDTFQLTSLTGVR